MLTLFMIYLPDLVDQKKKKREEKSCKICSELIKHSNS